MLDEYELPYSQFKDYTNYSMAKIFKYSGITSDQMMENSLLYKHLVGFSAMLSPSVSTKFSVHYGLYCTTLRAVGTEKH